ncbi:hypothetical protein CAPTEDRAFT_169641, partial [Capitella teleta]
MGSSNMHCLTLVIFVCLSTFIPQTEGQCDLPANQRRDCFPWPALSQESCESRGCVYCPDTDGPWCFFDDTVCPSEIPESSRSDCFDEPGASPEACRARGCIWCETETEDIPFCFHDDSVSQGGEFCPDDVPENERVDCLPEIGGSMETCLARGCYWCESGTPNVPWCFMSPLHGYRVSGEVEDTVKGQRVHLRRVNNPSWFGEDVVQVDVDIEYQEDDRLRVKIYDPSEARYEVPLGIPSPDDKATSPLYEIQITESPSFALKIIRISSGETIFDLSHLIFSNQYLQFSAQLSTEKVFGFGETEHETFAHDMDWRTWAMWARDQPVTQGNLYSVHPFFTSIEPSNDMFGCLILNSNAMEVTLTPLPGIQYRTSGGILDLYFFFGPEPEAVISQYTEAVGRPVMTPYWNLGFHLSRYGYNTLDNMKEAVERMRLYDIPHDVQHGDLDYFERNLDFTYDPVRFAGFPDFLHTIRQDGTRFITLLDPFISTGEPSGSYPPYETGMTADVWVKEADGVTNAESMCWPEDSVHYPDYSKESTKQWWIDECVDFHSVLQYDALWIDMNEPASFVTGSVHSCLNNSYNAPIYRPESLLVENCAGEDDGWFCLADKTICLDYTMELGRRYDVHSLYGWSSSEPSLQAAREATGTRSYIITRSTYPGSGKWAGRWLGDNQSAWYSLKTSIIGMMEFNMFGIPFVGADICGYFTEASESLCNRWMQLGAFYTFSRNHNGDSAPQDPGLWPEVGRNSREVLLTRYTLLPYLYTLFHEAHTEGRTVIRPVMHEFINDVSTHAIDEQFLWGPALLISPVLYEFADTVTAYFPDERWYNYYDGNEEANRGEYGVISAPADTIPLHVRGGHVLPTQRPANSTMWSRSNPMGLIVALDDDEASSGSLFWDDGDSIDTFENGLYFLTRFDASLGVLKNEIVHNGYPEASSLSFADVNIWGLSGSPNVMVNGQPWFDFDHDPASQVLRIFNLDLQINELFEISW